MSVLKVQVVVVKCVATQWVATPVHVELAIAWPVTTMDAMVSPYV